MVGQQSVEKLVDQQSMEKQLVRKQLVGKQLVGKQLMGKQLVGKQLVGKQAMLDLPAAVLSVEGTEFVCSLAVEAA